MNGSPHGSTSLATVSGLRSVVRVEVRPLAITVEHTIAEALTYARRGCDYNLPSSAAPCTTFPRRQDARRLDAARSITSLRSTTARRWQHCRLCVSPRSFQTCRCYRS